MSITFSLFFVCITFGYYFTTKKGTRTGVFHKAGFTCRNLVGRWLAAAVANNIKLINRREINPRPTIKGVRTNLFVLLFARLAMHGIVCYTL